MLRGMREKLTRNKPTTRRSSILRGQGQRKEQQQQQHQKQAPLPQLPQLPLQQQQQEKQKQQKHQQHQQQEPHLELLQQPQKPQQPQQAQQTQESRELQEPHRQEQQQQAQQPLEPMSPLLSPPIILPQQHHQGQYLSVIAAKAGADIPPEILLMIFGHWSHSKRTLARLRLVSRSFKSAADQYFRISLRIEDQKCEERFPKLGRLRAWHLLQIPHLISVLRVVDIPIAEDKSPITFDYIAANCTELKALSIFPRFKATRDKGYARVDHPYQQKLIQQLLQGSVTPSSSVMATEGTSLSPSGPILNLYGPPSQGNVRYRLKELAVGVPTPEYNIFPLVGYPFPASDVCRVPESLQGIEVLSIGGQTDWKSREFTMFCQHFPQLSQFALCIWRPKYITSDQRSSIMACCSKTHAPGTAATTGEPVMSATSFPTPQRLGIKTLRLGSMLNFGIDDVCRLLEGFPALEELDVRFIDNGRVVSCIEKSREKVTPVFSGLKRLSLKNTSAISLKTIVHCLVDLEEFAITCPGHILDRRSPYIVDAFQSRQSQLQDSPKRFLKKLEISHLAVETWKSSKFVKRASLSYLLYKLDQFHYLETLVLGAKLSLFMKVAKPAKAFRVNEYRFPPCFNTLRVLELTTPEIHEKNRVPDDVQDEFWKEYLPRMPNLKRLAVYDVWGLDRFPFRCGMNESPPRGPGSCWFAKLEKVAGVMQCACLVHTASTDISKTEPAPSSRYLALNRTTTDTGSLPAPIIPALPLPIPQLTDMTLRLYGQPKNPIMERWPVAFFDWIDSHFPEMERLHLRCKEFTVEIRSAMREEARKRWPDIDFVMDK